MHISMKEIYKILNIELFENLKLFISFRIHKNFNINHTENVSFIIVMFFKASYIKPSYNIINIVLRKTRNKNL